MNAQDIASKAAELVASDRDRQHGAKVDNFNNIAALWNAYLAIRQDPASPLTALDHAHMMVLLKIARTQLGDVNADDYVDGAGYMACAGEIALAAIAADLAAGRREFKVGDTIYCACHPDCRAGGFITEIGSLHYKTTKGCVPFDSARRVA